MVSVSAPAGQLHGPRTAMVDAIDCLGFKQLITCGSVIRDSLVFNSFLII